MTNRITRIILAGLVVWGVFSGCGNDSATTPDRDDNGGAPALPATSTMKFDLNFYGLATPVIDQQSLATGVPSEALLQSTDGGNHENWINAYVRAIFVYLATYDLLEEPIGAFAFAIHSVPQKQPDGSYLWTYIFVDKGVEYSVFLYGTPQPETVVWRLEVSSNDPAQPLDHFVWFSGESRKDGTSGYWQFFRPIDETNGVAVARIDWVKGEQGSKVTVTVNGSGLENEGDVLTFTESSETSSIEYYDASESRLSSIIWHADGSGSLTVPDYNGGATACWDHEQINVACE